MVPVEKSVVCDIDLLSSCMAENACSSTSFLSLILRSSFCILSFSNRNLHMNPSTAFFSVFFSDSIAVCKIPFSVLSFSISGAGSFKYFSLICGISTRRLSFSERTVSNYLCKISLFA